jgi:hypothetical protein
MSRSGAVVMRAFSSRRQVVGADKGGKRWRRRRSSLIARRALFSSTASRDRLQAHTTHIHIPNKAKQDQSHSQIRRSPIETKSRSKNNSHTPTRQLSLLKRETSKQTKWCVEQTQTTKTHLPNVALVNMTARAELARASVLLRRRADVRALSCRRRRRRCRRCFARTLARSLVSFVFFSHPLFSKTHNPNNKQTNKQSKKRGLSLEDKRDRVLEVFHRGADVLVLKDVEKAAAAKGVVLQSVKEVLQSLVDDDLVRQERIGAANYYWSFPAEASTKTKGDAERAAKEAAGRKADEERAAAALEAAKAARRASSSKGGGGGGGGGEDDDGGAAEEAELQSKAARVAELERAIAALREELQARASSDPRHLDALRAAARLSCDACGRWADNLGALRDFLAKKFEGRAGQLDGFMQELGYDEDKMSAAVEP